jgi:uncharacterized membrane protein YedE/YeeE
MATDYLVYGLLCVTAQARLRIRLLFHERFLAALSWASSVLSSAARDALVQGHGAPNAARRWAQRFPAAGSDCFMPRC